MGRKARLVEVFDQQGPHQAANRWVIGVPCASIPAHLLDAEILGREPDASAPGLLAQANGGTLFLDDVDRLPLDCQRRLLEALDPAPAPGAGAERPVSVRVIAAAEQPLDAAAGSGSFLAALLARLAGVTCRLPPLRERPEDIPALFDHFLDTVCVEREIERPTIHPEVLDRLQSYPWPGNVRELRLEVERLMSLQRGAISPDLLSHAVFAGDPSAALPRTLPPGGLKALVENLERRMLVDTLARVEGNKTRAASLLGLSRLGLRKKLERYGLTKL